MDAYPYNLDFVRSVCRKDSLVDQVGRVDPENRAVPLVRVFQEGQGVLERRLVLEVGLSCLVVRVDLEVPGVQ